MNLDKLDDMTVEEMEEAYDKIQEKIRKEASNGSPA